MNVSTGVGTWYRRRDKFPLLVATLIAVGPVLGAIANHPVPARKLVGLMAVLPLAACIGYLAGPAAAFGVTPERIIVKNPFLTYSVPRHLFMDVSVLENLAVQVVTRGGREVPVHAVLPALGSPYSQSYRQLIGKARTLLQLVEDVPPGPTTGAVERTPRIGSVLLVAGTAASFAGSVLLLTG